MSSNRCIPVRKHSVLKYGCVLCVCVCVCVCVFVCVCVCGVCVWCVCVCGCVCVYVCVSSYDYFLSCSTCFELDVNLTSCF